MILITGERFGTVAKPPIAIWRVIDEYKKWNFSGEIDG